MTRKQTIDNITRITAGLLASGHYTQSVNSGDIEGEPEMIKCWHQGVEGKGELLGYHAAIDASIIYASIMDIVDEDYTFDPEEEGQHY